MSAEAEAIELTGPPNNHESWKPSGVSIGFFFGMLATFLIWLLTFNPHPGLKTNARPPVPMPTQVDVNGTNWRIKLVTIGDPNLSGFTECDTRTILVSSTTQDKHEVLIHELLHAVVCGNAIDDFTVNNLWYNSKSNGAHDGIYKIAEIWSSLLRRNPDLAAYLGENN